MAQALTGLSPGGQATPSVISFAKLGYNFLCSIANSAFENKIDSVNRTLTSYIDQYSASHPGSEFNPAELNASEPQAGNGLDSLQKGILSVILGQRATMQTILNGGDAAATMSLSLSASAVTSLESGSEAETAGIKIQAADINSLSLIAEAGSLTTAEAKELFDVRSSKAFDASTPS